MSLKWKTQRCEGKLGFYFVLEQAQGLQTAQVLQIPDTGSWIWIVTTSLTSGPMCSYTHTTAKMQEPDMPWGTYSSAGNAMNAASKFRRFMLKKRADENAALMISSASGL